MLNSQNKFLRPPPSISVNDTSNASNLDDFDESSLLKVVVIGNPSHLSKSDKWNSLIFELLSQAYIICPRDRLTRQGCTIESLITNCDAILFIMTQKSIHDPFILKMLQTSKNWNIPIISIRDSTTDISLLDRLRRSKTGNTGQSTSKSGDQKPKCASSGSTWLLTQNNNLTFQAETLGTREEHYKCEELRLQSHTHLRRMINILSVEYRNAIIYTKSAAATKHHILRKICEIKQANKKQQANMNNFNFSPSLSENNSLMDTETTVKEDDNFLTVPQFLTSNTVEDSIPKDTEECYVSEQTSLQSASSTNDMSPMGFDDTCYWVFPEKGEDTAPKLIRWPHNIERTPIDEEWKSESSLEFQDIDLSIPLPSSSSLHDIYSDDEDNQVLD